MRLHEYQTKQLLAQYDIPVPGGQVAHTPEDAYRAAQKIGEIVVMKPNTDQPAIKALTPAEAHTFAGDLLDQTVYHILVEPLYRIDSEIYLGITYDRHIGQPVLVASANGDVENAITDHPQTLISEPIEPLIGLCNYQVTHVASSMNLPRELWPQFSHIALALYRCYIENDALLVEINPLAITTEQTFMALDAHMIIDDNALFRQPELAAMRDTAHENDLETQAREAGISYVRLDGHIGCMVNGAGLAMTLMDLIYARSEPGDGPANFLDIGGGASAERVALAARIILSDRQVRSVVCNIFGGNTRCDEVAAGIVQAYQETQSQLPLVVRLKGTNEERGLDILRQTHLHHLSIAQTLSEAAHRAIELAQP